MPPQLFVAFDALSRYIHAQYSSEFDYGVDNLECLVSQSHSPHE
jgi:hypothetical protein